MPWSLLTLLAPVLLAAGVYLWVTSAAGTSLDRLDLLLSQRRYDEALGLMGRYLLEHPADGRVRLLCVQVALDGADPRPREALRHIRLARPSGRRASALLRFYEGKAQAALLRHDEAERCWLDALRIDPLVPEAGWDLLGLYYVQGRRDDAGRLGLRLHETEPDPRDRVQLLVELLRQDAQPLEAASVVAALGPAAREHPEDVRTATALGLALVHSGRADEGLALLERTASRSPADADAWSGLLRGVDDAGRPGGVSAVLGRLPGGLAGDPRLARYRGAAALEIGNWGLAASELAEARRFDPSDRVSLYRLARALRAAGRSDEARASDLLHRVAAEAAEAALTLYQEADEAESLGTEPRPDLYRRVATQRERVGRPEEAAAWRRLATRLGIPRVQVDGLNRPRTIRVPEAAPFVARRPAPEHALRSRPAFRLGVVRAEADVALARANRLSDVYVSYFPYVFQNNAPFGTKSAHSWSVSATVPLPVFNRNQGNLARAKLNVTQTASGLQSLEQKVVEEVLLADQEYEVTRAAVEQIERDLIPAANQVRRRCEAEGVGLQNRGRPIGGRHVS